MHKELELTTSLGDVKVIVLEHVTVFAQTIAQVIAMERVTMLAKADAQVVVRERHLKLFEFYYASVTEMDTVTKLVTCQMGHFDY